MGRITYIHESSGTGYICFCITFSSVWVCDGGHTQITFHGGRYFESLACLNDAADLMSEVSVFVYNRCRVSEIGHSMPKMSVRARNFERPVPIPAFMLQFSL
jgi:hypothetical protein